MTERPRRILLVTADQWRGDCLGCAGHGVVRTPTLDRLAAEGVRFARHYAQCVPCGPSRASLLTGQYLMNHRSVRNGTPLDRRFTNLALAIRGAGYEPWLIGYTDTSLDPRGRPPGDPALHSYEGVLPGFEVFARFTEDARDWIAHLVRLGHDLGPGDVAAAFAPAPGTDDAERGPTFAPARFTPGQSLAAFYTDRAIDFVTGHADRPWLLHLSLLPPHPPFRAPAPYHALYDPAEGPAFRGAATAGEEAALHPHVAWRLGAGDSVAAWPEGHRRQLRATYWGMMTEVDHHLGRLLATLETLGQLDDTLIVFTSDHGEMLGDHWALGKEMVFDEAFHVPLLVRWPSAGAGGRVVGAFTEAVDVMPTLLDLAGLAVPSQCDGRSLAPLLAGETPADWRAHALWEIDFRTPPGEPAPMGLPADACSLAVLRGETTKYVHFSGLPPLFFDLAADPQERVDRSADPACREAVLGAAQALLSRRLRHAAGTLAGMRLTPSGLVGAG